MKMHTHEGHVDEAANFSTSVAGLAEAVGSECLCHQILIANKNFVLQDVRVILHA